MLSCGQNRKEEKVMHTQKQIIAKDILGNPDYQAISYGGYRKKSRDSQPTIPQLKEDMKILSAMGVKVIRTYNVQPKLPHASNILKAITELKNQVADLSIDIAEKVLKSELKDADKQKELVNNALKEAALS